MTNRFHPSQRSGLLACGLLLLVCAAPGVLTWQAWRQAKLDQALIVAVQGNDTLSVRNLLHAGADPNTPVYATDTRSTWQRGWEALRHKPAGSRAHQPLLFKAVCWLPPKDPQVEAARDQALFAALRQGKPLPPAEPDHVVDNAAIVQALVEAGANVNVRSGKRKATPLIAAAYFGKFASMKALLAHNAEVNAIDTYGMNALLSTAAGANADVIEALLQRGADIHYKDKQGKTLLMMVLDPYQQAKIADIKSSVACLLRHGIWVHPAPEEVQETMKLAFRFHDRQLLQMLKHAAKE